MTIMRLCLSFNTHRSMKVWVIISGYNQRVRMESRASLACICERENISFWQKPTIPFECRALNVQCMPAVVLMCVLELKHLCWRHTHFFSFFFFKRKKITHNNKFSTIVELRAPTQLTLMVYCGTNRRVLRLFTTCL